MKQLKRITLVIFCSVFHTTALAEELPTLDFNGNIMIDYDNFSAGFLEKSDDAADDLYLRRLSLGLESYFYQDWFANVDIDVSDGVELKDAYVKYSGWKKIAEFTLGKQKEPFGLEQLMSSKNLLMIERSMATNALAPERAYGIKSSGGTDVGVGIGTINWQLGYFQNHLQNHLLDDDEEKTTAITGKITWAPWQQNNNVLHLGASFSERDLNGELFKINQKMEVYGADSFIEGDKFTADNASLNGVEFVWQYHGLLTMAEWQQATVTATNNQEYDYQGGYYQMSYLFSGENRKYQEGQLSSVTSKNDWEITMRYSQLKLLEENSKAQTLSIGVNYYLNKNLKLMADYINGDYVDEGVDLDIGDALSLRVQYRF